jgi:glycosyltransferase involved in cell wall biosynthesis
MRDSGRPTDRPASPAKVPGVSFVVPTRNSVRTIRACLESIRSQEISDLELVVVDNSSADGTLEVARELADVALTDGPERSAQRNVGARASHGRFLVFVDSDMVLDRDVAGEVVRAFESDPLAGALVLPELSFGTGFWARCRVAEKRLYLGDPDVEAARAFRREAFEAVGGYDTSLTGPEDWDLPDRLQSSGWAVGRITAHVHHDEGRISLRGTFRKKRYYGRTVGSYVAGHGRVGVRKAARAALFRQPSRFVHQPATAIGLLGLKAVEFTGVAMGMLDGRRERAPKA